MTGVPRHTIEALSLVRPGRHVVTIGNFDGVHLGHQHLLSLVMAHAAQVGASSLVITFEPHPIAVLRPEQAPPRIATPDEKVRRLTDAGIEQVVAIPFDLDFASLLPEEFLSIIVDAACPTDVFVGEGFRFGKMRAGDVATLTRFGHEHDFICHTVPPLSDDHGVISSSRVRSALLSGEVDVATRLLGRRYRLVGSVEHGMARGRDLGYPTANLDVPSDLCVPRDGIYAGYARFDDSDSRPHEALIYIGTSPTFGDRDRLVEVNILDYRGDLYGHQLEIEFVAFVRGDQVFDTTEALMAQMKEDESTSRQVLSETAPESHLRGN